MNDLLNIKWEPQAVPSGWFIVPFGGDDVTVIEQAGRSIVPTGDEHQPKVAEGVYSVGFSFSFKDEDQGDANEVCIGLSDDTTPLWSPFHVGGTKTQFISDIYRFPEGAVLQCYGKHDASTPMPCFVRASIVRIA